MISFLGCDLKWFLKQTADASHRVFDKSIKQSLTQCFTVELN